MKTNTATLLISLAATFFLAACTSDPTDDDLKIPVLVCEWKNGKYSGEERYRVNFDAGTIDGNKAIKLDKSAAEFETKDAHFWINLTNGAYSMLSKAGTLIEASDGACHWKPVFSIAYDQQYRAAGESRPIFPLQDKK